MTKFAHIKFASANLIGKTLYRYDNLPCEVIEIVDELKGLVKIKGEKMTSRRGVEKAEPFEIEEHVAFLTEQPRQQGSFANKPDWFDTINGWKHPLSYNLHLFFKDYLQGKVNLDPEYQRDFVWTVRQQQEYIQAVLDGKVEPVIYACLEMDDKNIAEDVYEILDGKQRLNALFNFLVGKVSLPNGTFFENLSQKDAMFFRMLNLNVHRLTTNGFYRNLTNQEKLEIFLTLNEKGTRLSDSDLAHAKNVLSK